MARAAVDDYMLVASLDFGTTFSGYAFSMRDDPERIICNKNWGESLGFTSHKTPTSILTNDAGEFVAMGYEAEHQYTETLEEEGAAPHLHLYRHFKMLLHKSKDVHLKAVVTSLDGTIMPAVDIFGYAIRYLKDHLLEAMQSIVETKLGPSEILWVITVPAIWSESSKKFMREAAKRGGCIQDSDAKNLLLALEPEAASLCCRRPTIAGYRTLDGITFPPNTKYLVLDCGGGTVDITAHRTQVDGTIEEILPASGGPWGAMYVDREFTALLEDLFGKDFLNKFKSQHPQSWLQLLGSFETAKKPFKSDEKSSLRVQLPWSFTNFFSETHKGKPVQAHLLEKNKEGISFINGFLVLKQEVSKGLFDPIVQKTIDHTKQLLQDEKLLGCKFLFLVGGFSESKVLQDSITESFGGNGMKVLIPCETQLAVLKGATLFGHMPQEIATRVARKTYGYGDSVMFDPSIHDPGKKHVGRITKNVYCDDIFVPIVLKGEQMPVGKKVTVEDHYPADVSATECDICIFSIDGAPNTPTQYTDDSNVTVEGELVIHFPPGDDINLKKFNTTYTLGETEFHIHCINVTTKEEFKSTVNLD